MEVNTSSLETAHSIKNNIDVFLKDELFPRLEILFDDYQLQNEIVRFEKLTLNLEIEKWKDFEGIQTEIFNQLKEKINRRIPPEIQCKIAGKDAFSDVKDDAQQLSILNNSGEVFLFFLENGYLPWFGKEEQIATFCQSENWIKNLENAVFFQKLDQLFNNSELAVERFILQFPNEIIAEYLVRKNFRIKEEIASILKMMEKLNYKAQRIFLKVMILISQEKYDNLQKTIRLFEILPSKTEKQESERKSMQIMQEIIEIMQKLLPETVLQQSDLDLIDRWIAGNKWKNPVADKTEIDNQPIRVRIDKKTMEKHSDSDEFNFDLWKEKPLFFEKETAEIWVGNAGLILLHPFFKPFFIATEITDKQGKLLSENFDLAVQSLHYLATGNENVFETNLVFEKFLCGLPLKMPVQRNSLLTDFIKDEAIVLLNEVVKNWPALKNTSADGLRQMFIQRDGKLIQEDTKYKLIVERKVQDILLEKLNWNISMIKLPWISKILFTEW